MTPWRAFQVTGGDRITGLSIIGFQGAVDPASTPAQCAPVIVDDERRLSRIVELRAGPGGTEAVVESIEPPLPAEGPLPGVATRLHPLPAMLEGVVAILGTSERPLVEDAELSGLPSRVAGFLHWLRDGGRPSEDAPWGWTEDGLWACYLTVHERMALWKVLHAGVYRALRQAVRADDPARMIAGAFWLSRVVVYPESDFFKAAEALRRAGSPHWRHMLREGMRLKDEAAWEKGLQDASYAFDEHREMPSAPGRRYRARNSVRHQAANP